MDRRFRVVAGVGQGVLDVVRVGELRAAAAGFARKATADNTARSYRAGQEQFKGFCEELGKAVFPGEGEVVALWLAWLAGHGYKPATIRSRLSGVRRMYALAVGERNCTWDRCVLETYEGILRSLDGRQEVAEVVSVKEVVAMANAWRARGDVFGVRNAALILVGFGGAFRRSELCRMRWEGVTFSKGAVVIDLVHDKSQQRMTGQPVVIHRGRAGSCPVAALEAWREVYHEGHEGARREEGKTEEGRGLTTGDTGSTGGRQGEDRGREEGRFEEGRGGGKTGESGRLEGGNRSRNEELRTKNEERGGAATGPVFCGVSVRRGGVVFGEALRGWRVNQIVKAGADLAGIGYRGVSAHSLRAGMITALAMAGVSDRQTMQRSRHRSAAMVGRYVRPLAGMEMDWTGAVGL